VFLVQHRMIFIKKHFPPATWTLYGNERDPIPDVDKTGINGRNQFPRVNGPVSSSMGVYVRADIYQYSHHT
jgi:hypothetical protein